MNCAAFDPDIDGDGVYDDDGNCIASCNSTDPADSLYDDDIDGDGIYLSASDFDTDEDGIMNDIDDDIDGDGVYDPGLDGILEDDPNTELDESLDNICISSCNDDDNDIDDDGIENIDDDSPMGYDLNCQSNCNDDDNDNVWPASAESDEIPNQYSWCEWLSLKHI